MREAFSSHFLIRNAGLILSTKAQELAEKDRTNALTTIPILTLQEKGELLSLLKEVVQSGALKENWTTLLAGAYAVQKEARIHSSSSTSPRQTGREIKEEGSGNKADAYLEDDENEDAKDEELDRIEELAAQFAWRIRREMSRRQNQVMETEEEREAKLEAAQKALEEREKAEEEKNREKDRAERLLREKEELTTKQQMLSQENETLKKKITENTTLTNLSSLQLYSSSTAITINDNLITHSGDNSYETLAFMNILSNV